MAKRKRRATTPEPSAPCPCGRGDAFGACCGPLLDGADAATAEALMRSRYTAYATRHREYLLATWHPDTRPPTVTFGPRQRWTGLAVLETDGGRELDATGSVEFSAAYVDGTEHHVLHEVSRFVRVGGSWVYVDGEATLD